MNTRPYNRDFYEFIRTKGDPEFVSKQECFEAGERKAEERAQEPEDVVPAYFKRASNDERLFSLAQAVVSMTALNKSPGTFGEQYNQMAKYALKELERERHE